MRNRIIAAMSDAVIVVESKKSGGSIITAEFANSFNKDVFAVPGRVNDDTSEGCNKLIKQNKAHLLESAEDIAYIMRWEELDKERTVQRMLFVELSPDEQSLVDVLKQKEHCTIDELNYQLKMHPSLLAAMLIDLEFKGIVRSLPGKKYILV
jgi:DNA processing protein